MDSLCQPWPQLTSWSDLREEFYWVQFIHVSTPKEMTLLRSLRFSGKKGWGFGNRKWTVSIFPWRFHGHPPLREGPHQRSANLTYQSHRMLCLPADVANDRASWRLRHLTSARCRRNRFKVILNDTNIRHHWRIHWNWYNSVVGDYLLVALFQWIVGLHWHGFNSSYHCSKENFRSVTSPKPSLFAHRRDAAPLNHRGSWIRLEPLPVFQLRIGDVNGQNIDFSQSCVFFGRFL